MFYQTRENPFGQRALYRCWPSSAGFVSLFVRWIGCAYQDTD